MSEFFLASGSPRRSEILSKMQIAHTVCPAEADETVESGTSPTAAGELLATRKAIAARDALTRAGRYTEESLLLAADTLVYLDGVPLGKPKDAADAAAMLRALRGREHVVCTGVCMLRGKKSVAMADVTTVRMRAYSDAEIHAYIATGEPLDKAGAYGIQGIGAVLVDSIDGDYWTVMGLSPKVVARLMHVLGIPYFEYIQER